MFLTPSVIALVSRFACALHHCRGRRAIDLFTMRRLSTADLRFGFRRRAFVRTRIVLGKTEIVLRPLYDRLQRLTGLVPISSAEPNTTDGPVRVETRLGGFTLDDHARESLATVVGLLDSLCDCGLQKVARYRASVIGRFPALPNVHTPYPKYIIIIIWENLYKI